MCVCKATKTIRPRAGLMYFSPSKNGEKTWGIFFCYCVISDVHPILFVKLYGLMTIPQFVLVIPTLDHGTYWESNHFIAISDVMGLLHSLSLHPNLLGLYNHSVYPCKNKQLWEEQRNYLGIPHVQTVP